MPLTDRLSALLSAPAAPWADVAANITRVQDLYAALRANDLMALLVGLAPGVEWEEDLGSAAHLVPRRHVGRGAVTRLLAAPLGHRPPLDLIHVVGGGSQVAALVADVTEPASPRIEAHLWTIDEEGLVARFRQITGAGREETISPTRH